jgi:hypothetical protein
MNLRNYIIYLNELGFVSTSSNILEVNKKVPGFSGPHIMSLLNVAVANLGDGEIYLEVGTYRGKTLIGAMIGTNKEGYGVDDFSEFCDNPDEREIEINNRIKEFKLDKNVTFFRGKNVQFVPPKPIGVYFYDGNHDSTPGFEALTWAVPHLADTALIVVDDFSGEGVWESVHRFTSVFKNEARVFFSMHTDNFPRAHEDWWNGVIVLGWRKDGLFR